jgi:xylose isomerase
MDLGARELVVWSAFDGYDYSLQADYEVMWNHCKEAFRTVCDSFPDLKVSLEPKPTEPRRFFIHNTTGTAMLMVRDIDRENMGLTLDFGHCLMATENPGQSAALAGQEGRLFGVQLNDGFVKPGSEDGLALGTVHPLMTQIEGQSHVFPIYISYHQHCRTSSVMYEKPAWFCGLWFK